jgi:hypothetical protein
MSDEPPRPGRPPYWTLAAAAALLALPGGWLLPAVGGLVGAWLLTLAGRALTRARRGRRTPPLPPGAVRLGRASSGAAVTLSQAQLSAHGLIVGASGAGKSTTLLRLLTQGVEQGLPIVALDLKGSPAFARTLAAAADRAGRPFRLWTVDGPASWNPLAHGNPTELKDKLIAGERFTEPHYQRAAERYLQTAFTVLAAVQPARPPTLEKVVALCDPRRLSAALRRAPEPMRSMVQDYLAGLTNDQLSAVRGLGTRLALLTESHTGRHLVPRAGAPAIDIPAALRGEAVVVFSLNSSSYAKLAAQLGTMVVQDLVSAAGQRLAAGHRAASPQALVGIDEFSALGADHVVALLARGREAGIPVIVATQEFADLERAAPGLRDQVNGNTVVKIIHRQDVPASARMVSDMAGTRWVSEETRYFGSGFMLPRGNRRHVERPLVHPNRIMSLGTGEAVVITKLPETRVRLTRVERGGPEL